MIRLTNLADYAVVVMTAAAREPLCKVSATRIAEATAIPAPTVAKLMGTLARAGLLTASRGAAGGFCLARAPGDISVAEIVEAVDGPIALTNCQTGDVHDCTITGSCSVRGHWGPINRAVREALDAVTLASLLRPAMLPSPSFSRRRQPISEPMRETGSRLRGNDELDMQVTS